MAQSDSREQWGTRLGFILAAIGSAVGLGNVWRFPFQVGEHGGVWFVMMYLAVILIVGLPAMLVEFTIGRRSQRNPINAFEKLGYPRWWFIGGLCLVTGLIILSYYSVVGGWTIRYTIDSFTGAYFAAGGQEATEAAAAHFDAVNFGWSALGFHALFMAVVIGIVAFGVKRGIEMCTKILVPAIIIMLVGLMIYVLQLPDAFDGLVNWLSPELSVDPETGETRTLGQELIAVLPAAAGQAFFTLSLGMGAMITYSSYVGDDDNLVADSGYIVVFNTGIALLAGMVIFPVLFSVGISPEAPGAGALFVGFGAALSEIPGSVELLGTTVTSGQVLGAFFFGTVVIAAISSAISILEVVVSYIIDNFGVDRVVATVGIGTVIFLLGIPTAFDGTMLELYDVVTAEFLLPLGMGLLVLFVGWFYREGREELARGLGPATRNWLPMAWTWHVRTFILAVIVIVIAISAHSGYTELMEMFGN